MLEEQGSMGRSGTKTHAVGGGICFVVAAAVNNHVEMQVDFAIAVVFVCAGWVTETARGWIWTCWSCPRG